MFPIKMQGESAVKGTIYILRFGASAVQSLFFPHRRLFGNMSDTVSEERQAQLQTYLNGLVRNCAALQGC